MSLRLTQADAGNRAGISQSAWSRIERGGSAAVSLETLAACAVAVNSQLAAFIEETAGNRATLEEQLRFATMIAPKLTLQGGTTEVLRGIIARGLGLR